MNSAQIVSNPAFVWKKMSEQHKIQADKIGKCLLFYNIIGCMLHRENGKLYEHAIYMVNFAWNEDQVSPFLKWIGLFCQGRFLIFLNRMC